MKTRMGFVSNSSSASFICIWEYFDHGGSGLDSVEDALRIIFDDYGDVDMGVKMESIVGHTNICSSSGCYETKYWTSMYNDVNDIPEELSSLVMGLHLLPGSKGRIINVSVDEEG
jgi:hypothetical protein